MVVEISSVPKFLYGHSKKGYGKYIDQTRPRHRTSTYQKYLKD